MLDPADANAADENAASENTCVFHWEMINPFLPWQILEATFYQGNSTTWKATLQPRFRYINFRMYLFTLELDRVLDNRDQILANKIVVCVTLNDNPIERMVIQNYLFCARNRYTYSSFARINIDNPLLVPHLVVSIEIILPKTKAEIQDRDRLRLNFDNFVLLSLELKNMTPADPYSNMMLQSIRDNQRFWVHSYMINLRWNNFFTIHNFVPNAPFSLIDVNISEEVLDSILSFVYSGEITLIMSNVGGAKNFAELFQVIHRYRLYNIYKCFVRSDLKQVKSDYKYVHSKIFTIPISIVGGRPVDGTTFPVQVYLSPGNRFTFISRVRTEFGAGPWLSYSMHATTQIRFHVHVKLETVLRPTNRPPIESDPITPVHESDYIIENKEVVESGNVLFLACPLIFGDLRALERRGMTYSICCILQINDELGITQIQNFDGYPITRLERFIDLGNDMYKLLKEEYIDSTDFILKPVRDDEGVRLYNIHKAVFNSRLSEWSQVLVDCRDDDPLPDVARCILTSPCIPYVLEYLYTAKSSPIPEYLHDEIVEFARKSRRHFLTRTLMLPASG